MNATIESRFAVQRLARVDVIASAPAAVRSTHSRRRRARTAFVVFVGFVIILNFGLGLTAQVNYCLRDPAFGDKLAKIKTSPDVLMLGSSRTLLGFHARRVEETTGLTAFNFGTPATGPITHLVYLKRLQDQGIRPRLLLIEVLPSLLADGPDGPCEQGVLYGERLTRQELEMVERFGFDPKVVRPAWRESMYAPWSKLRFHILGRLAPSWVPWNQRFDWGRNSDTRGWSTPPRQQMTDDERAEHLARAQSEYASTLAGMDPNARPLEALRELIARGRELGAEVVLVWMPEAPSFRAMYPPKLDERILTALHSTGAPLIDARHWLPEDHFSDGHHMFTRGAEAFTDRLMREVRK
jgi:hypothetical protein